MPGIRSPSLMLAGRAARLLSRSGGAEGAAGRPTLVAGATPAAVAATVVVVVVVGSGKRPTSSQFETAGPRIRATRSAPTGRRSVSVVHQILRVTKSLA